MTTRIDPQKHACHSHYADDDLCFYLQVYKDYPDAVSCLEGLRRCFQDARVIVISDGDTDMRYGDFVHRYRAEYVPGRRLYTAANGGLMIQRMLFSYLQQPNEYLIKIDTDTRIHRRFRYLPCGPVVFGTLEWRTARFKRKLKVPNIQGGFIGFNRLAAKKLYDSGIFLSKELLDHRRTYADTIDIVRRVERQGLISMDHMIRYACHALDIPMIAFDEVYSVWRGKIARHGNGFAATHPHKSSRLIPRWRALLAWIDRPFLKK